MTKRLMASVAIVLVPLSAAGAQGACYPGANPNLAGVIGSTIGALIGSTIGDGNGQTLAIGASGVIGGLIGKSLTPRRPSAKRSNSVVRQVGDLRNQALGVAMTGAIPMPRKARPVRLRERRAQEPEQGLIQCQELEAGTLACLDAAGNWRIVR